MTKNVKDHDRAKEADKKARRGAPAAGKTEPPAQEIADDEVEIGKTGGKPGEGSRPITKRKS
jgi:hypothetical protein